MPELKRPLEPTDDSQALVLAKKPRNELVEVTEKSKALMESVSQILVKIRQNGINSLE